MQRSSWNHTVSADYKSALFFIFKKVIFITSWIFQGNPKKFRVDEYLENNDFFTWTIRQKHFKDDISRGDVVYIWRSNAGKPESGGIIARGKILSHPEELPDDAHEYWIEEPENFYELRVKIELEDLRLNEEEGMLKRIDLKKDETLKDLRIFNNWGHVEVNHKLEPKHSKHIDHLWESKKDKTHFSK